ncbi:hypothetical protein R1flu_023416 [Riccia fluitans]|uniref:Uncharacterized protein n=1 Tax=Riccia fluitans TaxID=41844 RepID=A0ABD1XRZ8_9MARC
MTEIKDKDEGNAKLMDIDEDQAVTNTPPLELTKIDEALENLDRLRFFRGRLAPDESRVTIPDLLSHFQLDGFFEFGQYSHQQTSQPRSRAPVRSARRRILEAIGSCPSVEIVREQDLLRYRLTKYEWEIVLTPLLLSTSLEEISLVIDRVGCDNEPGTRCELWKQVLRKTQTLKTLDISFDRSISDVTTYFLELASGLKDNPYNAIEVIKLRCTYTGEQGGSGVHIIDEESYACLAGAAARLIQCATNWQVLHLRGILGSAADIVAHSQTPDLTGLETTRAAGFFPETVNGVKRILAKILKWGRKLKWSYGNSFSGAVSRELRIDGPFPAELWEALPSFTSDFTRIDIQRLPCTSLGDNNWWTEAAAFINSYSPTSVSVTGVGMYALRLGTTTDSSPKRWVNLCFSHSPQDLITGLTKFSQAFQPNGTLPRRVWYHVDNCEQLMWSSGFSMYASYAVLDWILTNNFVEDLSIVVKKNEDLSNQFLETFKKIKQNTSITTLSLDGISPFSSFFPSPPYPRWWRSFLDSLASNTSVKCLDLARCQFPDESFEFLMSLFQANYSLEKVELTQLTCSRSSQVLKMVGKFSTGGWEALFSFINSFRPASVSVTLNVSVSSHGDDIRQFTRYMYHAFELRLEKIMETQSSPSDSIKIDLTRAIPRQDPSDFWRSFFQSLESSTSVKHLDLAECHLTDSDFQLLISLLQANFSLERVELTQLKLTRGSGVLRVEGTFPRELWIALPSFIDDDPLASISVTVNVSNPVNSHEESRALELRLDSTMESSSLHLVKIDLRASDPSPQDVIIGLTKVSQACHSDGKPEKFHRQVWYNVDKCEQLKRYCDSSTYESYAVLDWILTSNFVEDLSVIVQGKEDLRFQEIFSKIKVNTSITTLSLVGFSPWRSYKSWWRSFFGFLGSNSHVKFLDLARCHLRVEERLDFLMSLLQANISLEAIDLIQLKCTKSSQVLRMDGEFSSKLWKALLRLINSYRPASISITVNVSKPFSSREQYRALRLEYTVESSPSNSVAIDLRPVSPQQQDLIVGLTEFCQGCLSNTALHGWVWYYVDNFEKLQLHRGKEESYDGFLDWILRNNFVEDLSIVVQENEDPQFQEIFRKIERNTSIRTLSLLTSSTSPPRWYLGGRWLRSFFGSLETNTSVKCLNLAGCHLPDESFGFLMALLNANYTLEKVELRDASWENDGKMAKIKETLTRNRNMSSYFSTMKLASIDFGPANIGRIFLCGSPYAGKTQLKMTMMRTCNKISKSESLPGQHFDKVRSFLKRLIVRRTLGIEVELLRDDDWGQVFIWDLAGQFIFRALQDLIFPRTNTTCLFVFVFNPFQERSKTHSLKEGVYREFQREFEVWLKFIVSNSQIMGGNLPQVLAVITHEDWSKNKTSVSNRPKLDLGLIQERLVALRARFADGAEVLCDVIYHIDAHSKAKVKALTTLIFDLMGSRFSNGHYVPKLCSQLSSALIRSSRSFNPSPLWTQSTFHQFCRQSHNALRTVSPEVLQAIVSYLHDVGSIIKVPRVKTNDVKRDEPWILVDPNWVTQNLLGELITQGCRFSEVEGTFSEAWDQDVVCNGLADGAHFRYLLRKVLGSKQNQWRKIEVELVEEIMQELDLCYKIQEGGHDRCFVPIVYGGLEQKWDVRRRTYQPQWDKDNVHLEERHYLGYRLECKNVTTTALTAAFFPRFEVFFRQKLIKHVGVTETCINCYLGIMKIRHNGYEIFVESDEVTGCFVDVLVKSSVEVEVPRGSSELMKFVKTYVVQEIQAFCASSEGCPGVELVVSIIRSRTVKELVPIHERKDKIHCVKLEVLKQKFRYYVERNTFDGYTKEDAKSFLNFHYSWSNGGVENIKDLIDDRDIKQVVMGIQGSIKEIEVHLPLKVLQEISTRLDTSSDLRVLVEGPIAGEGRSSSRQEANSSVTGSGSLSLQVDGSQLTEGEKFLADKIDRAVNDLKSHIDTRFSKLNDHLRNFRLIFQEIQSALSDINSKVDKLIGYSLSRGDHASPRRPYFTLKGTDVADRIKSFVLMGKAVCLHFMCEARNGPHVVNNQPGLSLVITKEKLSWVSYISKISIRCIMVMLHAGIAITTGLGCFTPEFWDLDTGNCLPMSMELFKYLKLEPNMIDPKDPKVIEAWFLLQDHLAKETDQSEYGKLFLLRRVRYRCSTDPYAWLCPLCVEKGTRQNILHVC